MTKNNKIKKEKIKVQKKLKLNIFKTPNPIFFNYFEQLLIKLFASKYKKIDKMKLSPNQEEKNNFYHSNHFFKK
ncbi:hypothetical protein BBA70_01990 [New Jersey aster yellows phytoplasma]|uniref:Uncharacterized protein n=1 Tax=New Jersey aster yellows phytoplasma TaxID=270520 RepID=A0ABX4K2L7_9MOLU|nr:hypothetical protein BBA70_01990 [New Jersey aster yellows phytoplasma]